MLMLTGFVFPQVTLMLELVPVTGVPPVTVHR
jgi:hypothetical protein